MDITNNGELIMPNNCVIVSNNEMEYVDGGYYMNHDDCNALRFAIGMTVSMNASTVAGLITAYSAGGIAAVTAGIPVIGWIAGAYGGLIIIRSAEQIASALVTEMFYRKGIDFSIGFSWFTPYIKASARTK